MEQKSKAIKDWNKNKIEQKQLKDNINADLFVKTLKLVIIGEVDKEVLKNFYK